MMTLETQKQNGKVSGEAPPISLQNEPTPMLLTVIGKGRARAIPDQAVFLAIVISSRVSASQALQEAAARLEQVVQAVLARGLTQVEVQVTWANVVPSVPSAHQAPASSGVYSSPNIGQAQLSGVHTQTTGLIASYGLQIVLPDANHPAEIIDATKKSGANIAKTIAKPAIRTGNDSTWWMKLSLNGIFQML